MSPELKASRPVKVIQLKQRTTAIIVAILFGMIAALFYAYLDLGGLHTFDKRRDYDICLGANAQLNRVTDELTKPAPGDDPVTQALNQRRLDSRRQINEVIQKNREDCKTLLAS